MPVRSFVRHAQEEHGAGDLFQHVGEIFRAHDRLLETAEGTGAEQVMRNRFAQVDRAGIAQGDREAGRDRDARFSAVSRRNSFGQPGQRGVQLVPVAR